MRTILVGPELEENLGLRYLAGALVREGHRCDIVAFDHSGDLEGVAGRILRAAPDLVGLALVAQHRFGDVQALVDLLRRRHYGGHITAGGHFASLRAPEILTDAPGLDSILHHDAEERIVALARWLEGGATDEPPSELDGISWRGALGLNHRAPSRVAPIDSLPRPRRRSPDRCLGYPTAPLIASRGCAGSCAFCSIHAWHRQVPSGRLRFRAPERVAEEMAGLHRDHRVRVFVFHDDDFLHPDRRHALSRCRAILDAAQAKIGEPFAFVVKARPDDVEEGLFRYLKSRGLARTYVGIETHSHAGIRALNRRVTPEQNLAALATLADLDVYACFNLLLYHPDTTPEELEENLAFLEEHVDVPFDVARTELYACSALENRMVREGRAIGDYRGYDYRITDPVAEASFRLFAHVLWDRHFAADSILKRVQGLRLRLSLLERFHPHRANVELRSRVQALVRDTNRDTVSFLRRHLEIARHSEGVLRADVVTRARWEMEGEIRTRLRSQTLRWAALSLEVEGRALLGRSGLRSVSLLAGAPRMAMRLTAAVPGMAAVLASLACGGTGPGGDFYDPPPPPCIETLALHFGETVRANGLVDAGFVTTESGRLDIFVDWTHPSSHVEVYLASGACPPEALASGTCNVLETSGGAEKPRRFSVADAPAGSYTLAIFNAGPLDESVVAQVVLRSSTCPTVAAEDGGGAQGRER